MTELNIHHILERLPHRYPFILVDKVIEIELPDRLVAVKNVSMNEPVFQGHFPGTPVFPGVLILESLAQASVILAYQRGNIQEDSNGINYFAGINNARFKRVVEPGDQLHLEIQFQRERLNTWKLYGEATVDGELACSADLMCIRKEFSE